MSSRLESSEDFELVTRESFESDEIFDLDAADFQSTGRTASSYSTLSPRSVVSSLLAKLLRRNGYQRLPRQKRSTQVRRRALCRPSRRCCFSFQVFLIILAGLLILTAIFNPSYTHPPKHYATLKSRVEASHDDGRANPENQKIFIAASLYDQGGHLLGGSWGQSLLKLINILGDENVFLSVYENSNDLAAMNAQTNLKKQIKCKNSIVYDKDFAPDDVPRVTLPDGSERVKRIAFLAEVRNKALKPLYDEEHGMHFDKVLYLNDAAFNPLDAAQLLLSTNLDENGQTSYRAACAVDFINPFKFYDTFATRDLEGYGMGVPFFPWFGSSGNAQSRKDVLQGRDAVRVKSCWGGMVAFDAKPFLASEPLRFRATEDLYWDASECCLIHADLMNLDFPEGGQNTVGVYMNPFVRVAYGSKTLRWLHFIRRFERLYTIPHLIINRLVGLPWFNPRRTEGSGGKVEEKVWVSDKTLTTGGSFQMQERKAKGDGFCGRRGLQLIKESPRQGEKNWESVPVPPG